MRKVRELLRQLIGVFIFLIIAVALAYILKWGRGFSIADSFPGSEAGASAYPPPVTQGPASSPSTPYPGPLETQGTQVVHSSPTTRATLVPIPPPGWPTDQPWPPDDSIKTPFPTKIYTPFPTPGFSSTPMADLLRSSIRLWFPYYEKTDTSPQLKEARLNNETQRIEILQLPVHLYIPVPLRGPDPGPILLAFHLSPDSRWLVADFAYRGSQLIDLSSEKTKDLPNDFQSKNWKFFAWVPNDSPSLLVSDQEFPREDIQKFDPDLSKIEPTLFFSDEKATLRAIAYSHEGTSVASAFVYPAITGVRKNELAEVRLIASERHIIAEIDGGVSFVDYSLKWSPDGSKLIWIVNNAKQGFSSYELWIADQKTGTAKKLIVIAQSIQYNHPPAWSPDGARIAVIKVQEDNDKYSSHISLLDPLTGIEKQVAYFDNKISNLQWFSNEWLVFTLSKGDYGEIWMTSLDGSQQFPIAGPTLPDAPIILFSGGE